MTTTIEWLPFSKKHKRYIKSALRHRMCVAEGAIRSGKTIDNCIIAAMYLEQCPDKIHLASGSTSPNAKLNIGACNGYGLENLFRGRCRWGKYKDNDALYIHTQTGEKVVIFAGGGKADSYKRILGNSYGMWIATEINEHYDSDDSRESFIKVSLGRQTAAKWPLILWDLNPSAPGHTIYRDYIDRYKEHFEGGYLYEHFTMEDNLAISPERIKEIKGRYEEGSIWYQRDILGLRVQAQGLIYRQFAERTEGFMVYELPPILFATIGVDFGGNGSATAFNLTGFTAGMREIITLKEYYHKGIQSPAELERDFVAFAEECRRSFIVQDAYCDSAEQTLIQGLRTACAKAGIGIQIHNARKGEINDRIRFFCRMQASGRHKIFYRCQKTLEAFQSAVWDSRHLTEDVRLDNGSYNIDSLDAQEYAVEPYMRQMIQVW